jgi:hypothetical protein
MRERLPRYLIDTGAVLLVVGIAATVTLVARRSHCSANPYSDNSACLGDNTSSHVRATTTIRVAQFDTLQQPIPFAVEAGRFEIQLASIVTTVQ